MTKVYQSFSSAKTKSIGRALAEKIVKMKWPATRSGIVVALEGELGSGKTTFTRGFVKGLGLKEKTSSPTFVIVKRFSLPPNLRGFREAGFKNFFHVDLYRLRNAREINCAGLKKILSDGGNIVLIEWADRIRKLLPKSAIKIRFEHGGKENERWISFPMGFGPARPARPSTNILKRKR